MDSIRKRFRDGSIRAQWWDYSCNGVYIITIVTQDRFRHFGEVWNGIMHLSETGTFAWSCWQEIPDHFPFARPGNFVVMPDHVHGSIHVEKDIHDLVFPYQKNSFKPQSRNLASIVMGVKVGVTKQARRIDPSFGWQSRYHDRIIRDEEEYYRIEKYISKNPSNWIGL